MMRLFKNPLARRPLTPEAAGKELFVYAKSQAVPDYIAKISGDPQTTQAITSLIYLTKAAIVISSLRREAGNGPPDCRPYLVADAFEKEIFSELPFEEHAQLTACIKDLLLLAKELERGISEAIKKEDKDRLKETSLRWCRSWLGAISDNGDFVERTSFLFGSPLSTYVYNEISSLGESVKRVLYANIEQH